VWRQLDRERAKHVGPVASGGGEATDDGTLPAALAPESGEAGIHLVPSSREKKRQDSPPWPSTAATELPVQLSLFG
jgi:hypothetical protein